MKTKQQIWNRTLSRTQVKNNILQVWNKTTPEDQFNWYAEARRLANIMAIKHGVTIEQACGVIAALSPRMNWSRNLEMADLMIDTGDCKAIGQFKDKAGNILRLANGDQYSQDAVLKILNGSKISSFFLNILYPGKSIAITIDRHAISIAMGRKMLDEDLKTLTVPQYEFLQECYRWAATKIGVSPLLLQSATWVVWRRMDHKTKS